MQRFRHARGIERQQLKWMAFAGSILAVGVAMLPATTGNKPLQLIQEATVLAVPFAVGVAILRYRLYDVDLLVKRTVVYGVTTAAIAVTFFIGIVALQEALRPLTSGSELAVAVSTLVSFALFQPVRRRVQDEIDRRFDRSRYDAARTLDTFSEKLRDEVDLERVEADLVSAVSTTMAPQHVSLWLRNGLHRMGSYPVTISGRPVVRKELA